MATPGLWSSGAFALPKDPPAVAAIGLEGRRKGQAADIEKELRANLLPGVTIVPAMVIAIEQAQGAGIRYNPRGGMAEWRGGESPSLRHIRCAQVAERANSYDGRFVLTSPAEPLARASIDATS